MTTATTTTGIKRKVPAIEDTTTELTHKILHHRLWVGLGNKGGAKGSLTKCVTRVGAALRNASDQNKEAAIRELEHQRMDLLKLVWMVQRNQLELSALRASIDTTKQQASDESVVVQEKRKELQKQLTVTACEREYEALAKLAATRHPTSRRALQQQLDCVSLKTRETEEAIQKTQKEVAIRQSQFQLLMQCVLDLKQSLQEPLDVSGVVEVGETAMSQELKDDDDEKDENKQDAVNAMEVEPTVPAAEEDLYGDL